MSRTRIVKGKITEITGGTSRIFAKSIKINSGRSINYYAKNYTYGEPQDPPASKYAEFDIDFELNMDENTMVPFGILDCENNIENPYFSFKYALRNDDIDSLGFKITDEENEIIYQMGYLKPVIIQARKKPLVLFEAKKTTEGPLISKTWEYKKLFAPYVLSEPDYTKRGEYHLNWDGFDNDEIYDSTRFAGKKLKATITATKGDIIKAKEIEFEVSYKEVEWVDVKINRNTKRIDVTLRVNLADGGEKGLTCQTINANMYGTPERTVCDWDKIPTPIVNPSYPIIKSRTRSFSDLEKLALDGIERHWSRKSSYSIIINNEKYELTVKTINTSNKSLNELSLTYNTNGSWGRSGNPGFLGIIFYNVGYCNFLNWYDLPTENNWGYLDEIKDKVEEDFGYTAAHELGHTILKTYNSQYYSIIHDDSSTILQNPNGTKSYKAQKATGEINLMHYFDDDPRQANYDYNMIVASIKDTLGLLWLTKLKIN